jgi:hypothetical protein
MRKVVIHIGHGKTGTSSIQKWLAENEEILHHHNYHYLHSYRIYNAHHNLAPNDKSPLHVNIANSVRAEVSDTDRNIVVSSEQLYYTNPQNFKNVCDLFEGLEIEVVLYVRWHEELIISTYMQWLRENKDPCESAFEFFKKYGRVFQFRKRINYLYSHLRFEPRTRLRVYTDGNSFDALNDFLSVLSIERTEIAKISANESISPIFSEVLLRLNRSSISPEHREGMLAALQRASRYTTWNLGDIFSEDQRAWMKAYFMADDVFIEEFAEEPLQREYWKTRLSRARYLPVPAVPDEPASFEIAGPPASRPLRVTR